MLTRLDCVVDRHAAGGTLRGVRLHDGVATAVREDQVVLGNEPVERITIVHRQPLEGGGRIDVPEDHPIAGTSQSENLLLQEIIVDADPARLDHDVRVTRGLEAFATCAVCSAGYTTTRAHSGSSISRCACRSKASGS